MSNYYTSIQIGFWVEKEPRKVTDLTSYAADHIEKVTVPGKYPLALLFSSGYMLPMPQWIVATLDANTVGGGYYSGFCGRNFGFTPATLGPSQTHVQMYAYQLEGLEKAGKVELNEYANLADWQANPTTWEEIRRVVDSQAAAEKNAKEKN